MTEYGLFNVKWIFLLLIPCVLTCILRLWNAAIKKPEDEPDSIPYYIPGLGNAYQYVFHNMDFLKYVLSTRNGREVLQFCLGPKRVYLVTGCKFVDKILRNSGPLDSDKQSATMLQRMASVTDADIEKYISDTSGRRSVPLTTVPVEKRIWHAHHRLMMDHLASPKAVQVMTLKFCELFSETLRSSSTEEWKTVHLYSFLEQHMAAAAVASMFGTRFLEEHPDFIKDFWKYDKGVYSLVLGTPRFLSPGIYAARDVYHEHGKYFQKAHDNFDWKSPSAVADWEPVLGSRFSREHAKFLDEWDFDQKSRAGMRLGVLWAQNANTIPITAWIMIEMMRDEDLFRAVKTEVRTALVLDNASQKRQLDMKKLSELALLQSVYTETLRMHVSVNITREVTADMHLDRFLLKSGSLVQTPSWIAHFDEHIWCHSGHPATEFWAQRHLIYDGAVPHFSVGKKSGGFFPFGGGVSICPGRHFAKLEVMAAVALLVVNLDFEFVEYVCMDGKESNRGPKDNTWYCGAAAMPPDRDMKIRWRRCADGDV